MLLPLERVLRSDHTGARVLADRGYDSAANRRVLEQRDQRDSIARHAPLGQIKGERLNARNHTIDRVRARVEHAFADLAQLGGQRVQAMMLASLPGHCAAIVGRCGQ